VIQLFHQLLDFLGRGLSFFYDLIPNYGVAIILLTAAVRLVMLPLTIKQTRSMQEMQKLQPQIKALQTKYKGGDRQKLNEEMMKLYKEHKVNPLGGCLPLVLQLPVFLALYRVFAGCGKTIGKHACAPGYVGVKYLPAGSALARAIRLGKAGFLGMNLGISPVTAQHEVGLVHALPYYVLVFAMVATTWYQQKQISAVSTGQQAQQMQMMGKIMPLLLGVFSLNLPAGVSIYWVASNLWTIGQQRFILGSTIVGAPQAEPSGSAAGARGATAAKPKVSPKPNPSAASKTPPRALPKAGEKASPKTSGGRGPQSGARAPAKASEGPAAAGGDGAAPNGRGKPPPQASQAAKGNGKAEPKGPQQASSGNKQPGSSSRPRNSNARKKRRR